MPIDEYSELEKSLTDPPDPDDEVLSPSPGVDDAPPKKRRGRPPKNPESVAEEKIGSDAGPGKAKPGPKKRKFGGESVDLLAKQLAGIHNMAAMIMGEPVMILSETESVMLATALVGIAEEYGVMLTGKMAATLQLLGVAGMVYVPRFIDIQRKHARNPPNTVENGHNPNDQPG